MNILDAIKDPAVFGQHFKNESWAPWRVFLAALFALPMQPEQLAIYKQCTGRTQPPMSAASEAWLVCGRRAGKSFVLAVIAVFLATFRDWRPYLAPGERATIMIIAADRRQARTIMRYCKGLLHAVPMLAHTIEGENAESISLRNSVSIEVHTASYKSIRGYAVAAALLDELAFWPGDDSTEPDTEIIAAIRPALATIPGAVLLCASSPYARRGALWDAHRKHYGKDSDILVWQAATRTMNPTIAASIIETATVADPASAAAEYGAQFRSDIENYISREALEACVALGTIEHAPAPDFEYAAFVDPSGGSTDAMTMAIGHREDETIVIDALRERRPPFSPEDVVVQFSTLLKRYHITKVAGDRYGAEWTRGAFAKVGIDYTVTLEKSKQDFYRDLLPVINSKQIVLLDDDRLVAQLCSLERRTTRGGRDSIDHPPNAKDDVANAVAGLVAQLGGINNNSYDASLSWVRGDAATPMPDWGKIQLGHYIHSFRR